MQRYLARAFAVARRDAIGALVDRREAEVLQDRHALRQLHGRTETVDRGMHAARLAVEVDGDCSVRPQSLDALDVLQRPLRRKRLGVARGKGRSIFALQLLRRLRITPRRGYGVHQPVLPRADDLDDLVLELDRGD